MIITRNRWNQIIFERLLRPEAVWKRTYYSDVVNGI